MWGKQNQQQQQQQKKNQKQKLLFPSLPTATTKKARPTLCHFRLSQLAFSFNISFNIYTFRTFVALNLNIYIYILYIYICIYIQKLKSQKLDVLEGILNKKHIFNCHKYFGCFT